MDDDFNTPEAMAVLFRLAKTLNKAREDRHPQAEIIELAQQLKFLGGIVGLLQQNPEHFIQSGATDSALDPVVIEQLINQRQHARATQDYAESDRIRNELTAMGVVLEDSRSGTTWRRA